MALAKHHFVPAAIVDALPAELWTLGNGYTLFDRALHFCVAGPRSIELDGEEIGIGERPFVDFLDIEVPVEFSVTADELAAVQDLVTRVGREVTGSKPASEHGAGADSGQPQTWTSPYLSDLVGQTALVFHVTFTNAD